MRASGWGAGLDRAPPVVRGGPPVFGGPPQGFDAWPSGGVGHAVPGKATGSDFGFQTAGTVLVVMGEGLKPLTTM